MSSSEEDGANNDSGVQDALRASHYHDSEQFFATYRTWRSWLRRPRQHPPIDVPMLEFYLTWLEAFLQGDSELGIGKSWMATSGERHGVQAIVMWIWIHLEYASDWEVEQALLAAAMIFQGRRRQCTLAHPRVLMLEAGALHGVTDYELSVATNDSATLHFLVTARETS